MQAHYLCETAHIVSEVCQRHVGVVLVAEKRLAAFLRPARVGVLVAALFLLALPLARVVASLGLP